MDEEEAGPLEINASMSDHAYCTDRKASDTEQDDQEDQTETKSGKRKPEPKR